MNDQAQRLRELSNLRLGGAEQLPRAPAAGLDFGSDSIPKRVIAVTSGKGGVGKTNLTVNLAIAMSRLGQKVLVIDGDLGLANIDLIMGITPKYNLQHLIQGRRDVREILVTGPVGVKVLAGGSGIRELANLNDRERSVLLQSMRSLERMVDVIFIDTGAGISKNVIQLLLAADEILLVTTPEPTSITDAYGIVKVVSQDRPDAVLKLVVNMAQNRRDAEQVARTLMLVARQFLNIPIEWIGFVPMDLVVSKAVRMQKPFLLTHPVSKAAAAVNEVALALLQGTNLSKERERERERETEGSFSSFISRLFSRSRGA